jgi:large subunit ribosomal protein L10
LILLGARVEGRVFDFEGARWVGSIDGGLDGLRAQVVHLLQGVGAGVTTALEGVGRGLWMTVEGRRIAMEEEAGGGKKEEKVEEKSA